MNWKKLKNIQQEKVESLMRHRGCPVCDAKRTREVLRLESFQFFTDDSVSKQVDLIEVQCQACGALYLNPCYSNEGFARLFNQAGQSYGSTQMRPLEQVRWLESKGLLRAGARLLDIGCGSGVFLSSLPEAIQKGGVDIDQQSIDTAREQNPEIEFICSSFESLDYCKQVDIFTLYHVLEHLPDPKGTLERLHKIASEHTVLVVEVPILEKGLTNDINGFFSAQHLTHFSRTSLKNLLASTGWSVEDWHEMPDYNGCRVLARKGQVKELRQVNAREKLNTHRYLQNWYQSIGNVEEKLLKLKAPNIVIWGGGMHLEFLYQTTSLFDITRGHNFIVVDRDPLKQGLSWRGLSIYSPDVLKNLSGDFELVISSYGGQEKIAQAARDLGITQERIFKLYDAVYVY